MRYIYSLKLCSLSYLNMFKDAENYHVASCFFFVFVLFFVCFMLTMKKFTRTQTQGAKPNLSPTFLKLRALDIFMCPCCHYIS